MKTFSIQLNNFVLIVSGANVMDSEVVAQCVGPLSKVYLSKCPHHIAPCNNLHSHISNQTLSDVFSSSVLNPIPLVASIPVPLIRPSKLSRTGKKVFFDIFCVCYMLAE